MYYKKNGRPNIHTKKLVFYTEISTFALIEFSKIVDFYRIIELLKAKQTDIPDYQFYVGCNTNRMVGLTFIQKKLVIYTEISTFSLIEFSKIVDFYRIIQLPKANQIDIADYQYYLGCNAKGMIRLTFLEKSSYFSRNFRLIRLFYFQKYRIFIGSRSCPNRTKLGMEYPMCS